MSDTPTPAPEPTTTTVTATVSTGKPEYKQVSNYIGAAAIGLAGAIVANPAIVTAFVPAPWNTVAAALIGALGTALVAYREKHKVSSVTMESSK